MQGLTRLPLLSVLGLATICGSAAAHPAAPASIMAATLAPAVTAAPQGAGWHKDELYGYKIRPPKAWKQIPLKADASWLIAKYMSDRTYIWVDKLGGWDRSHKPEMMVIAFIEEVVKKKKEVVKKTDDEGNEVTITSTRNPYKDYEDFLDRTYTGGGFFISDVTESKVGDVAVTKYEVKVEKLVRAGPKRILTWIYHLEGVDLAIQIEVLEAHYKKLKKMVEGTLKSFKTIERTKGPLPSDLDTNSFGLSFISFFDMKKGSPEERQATRLKAEMHQHEKVLDSLPKGWTIKHLEAFIVVYNCEKKHAQRVIKHGELLYKWLDKNLGFIGPEEYVRRPVIRICATEDEMDSFNRGIRDSSGWSWRGSGREIVTCRDTSGFALGYEMRYVNRDIFDYWLQDRDDKLSMALPRWISHGLSNYVEGCRESKGKLKFGDYLDDLVNVKTLVSREQNTPAKDLMQMTSSQFYGSGSSDNGVGFWNRYSESDMLVRFLLSKEGNRGKSKGLLNEYIKNLSAVISEYDSEDREATPSNYKAPKTEEEEAAQYKKRNTVWTSSAREVAIVERTFKRTFGAWSDKDWKAFQRAFMKYID